MSDAHGEDEPAGGAVSKQPGAAPGGVPKGHDWEWSDYDMCFGMCAICGTACHDHRYDDGGRHYFKRDRGEVRIQMEDPGCLE